MKPTTAVRAYRACRPLHDRDQGNDSPRRQQRVLAPSRDAIQLPPFEAFKDRESYYATALHELTYWTKAKHRPDRDFSGKRFGDHGYAREELVAELGAAFLCVELRITPEIRDDHAAYLGHWLTVLKEDKRAIFSAAAHALRAADYLNSLQEQHRQETESAAA